MQVKDEALKNKGAYESLMATLKKDNLKPFINHVEAQKGKDLSEQTADYLLEFAT